MACPSGISDEEKQRLTKLSSLFTPPHDATCSICGSVISAYLTGSEWVLKQHEAPTRRETKGEGSKQPAGKVAARAKISSPKAGTRRMARKATRRLRGTGISYLKTANTKRVARKATRRKR